MPYLGKQPASVPVTADDIPDNSITAAKIVDGGITAADIGADAVGLSELSATGTASTSTFLRGDNAWVAVDTNLVSDNSPQLGGDLDLNSNNITGTGGIPAANLTGTIAADRLSTAATQSASNNSTKIATTAYTDAQVATVVDSAPGTLNTLNELAAALGDDANFSTTVTNSIAAKLPLAGGTMTGTVISPSFTSTAGGTFTTASGNDLNIVYPDSRSLFIKEAGTTHVTVDNAGKVGIGTASPDKTLSVHSTSGSAGTPNGLYLYNEVHGGDSQIYMYGENDSGAIQGANIKLDPDAETFSLIGTGGQTAITIADSGKVGIGTSSPSKKLEIAVSGTDGLLMSGANGYVGSTNDLVIDMDSNNDYSGNVIKFTQHNGASELMRINDAGNVGIGTTTIASPENNAGPILQIGDGSNAMSSIVLHENGNKWEVVSNDDLIIQDESVVRQRIGKTGDITFYDTSQAEKVIIKNDGNVGIGVTPAMASASYNGLHIGATYPTMKLSSTSSGHNATDGFHLRIDSTPRVEYWNYENTDQVFANNNGEKLRIQSGGGISFNGDTAAANALDDYEEGTWTPAASGGASSVSGTYTKIGRLVHCEGSLTFPSQTNSGHATVEGLPFTINGSESGSRPTGAIRYTSYSAQDLFIHGNPSATTFNLYKKNTGGVGQANWTDMSGKRFDFNFIFQT